MPTTREKTEQIRIRISSKAKLVEMAASHDRLHTSELSILIDEAYAKWKALETP